MSTERPRAESPETSSHVDHERRAADVLTMHRLSRKADGGQALLQWLARHTGCWVGLFDAVGNPIAGASRRPDHAEVATVVEGLTRLRDRDLRTIVLDAGTTEGGVLVVADGPGSRCGLVVAVLGARAVLSPTVADAAIMLGGCRRAAENERTRRRVEAADARGREAVLHLLMSGHLATAKQIASTLSPPLHDPARVYVVECKNDRRREVVEACTELTAGRAWIVRCPVYVEHVIVIEAVPPDTGTEDASPLAAGLTARIDTCVVGAGEPLRLHETALGYEQAFHALATARGLSRRWAGFDATLELSAVIGRDGLGWADSLLRPLTEHVPARSSAPTGQELEATARSWLTFSTAATRHLKIHRNTLLARLSRIEELLDLDLERVGDQAKLDLAFRARAVPRGPDADSAESPTAASTPTFEELLGTAAARRWALARMRPLRESPNAEPLKAILAAWLSHDGRLSAAAEALGISVTGARKRLIKVEQTLHRSLLSSPSARHDLWLANRILAGDRRAEGEDRAFPTRE
ncbi:helix-turn-helix domain-containing protein [Embleya scabrispora]|uniref:helix-turn-helix domain-containing protein n=1 Tax=Embleya scabrispora TaxID=159449 RepID=UPI00037ADB4D|nr:helix-turn-helix domain-containing protein [Embleya scabrispora]MYS86714.1 PucR family transcriptional regulator [Streptomyces sp. SID5474]